jgi:hypothetical protein
MTRKFLIVTALVAGVAATAEAQICAGTAPFTAGKMRVGVGAEFLNDVSTTYGGEFAWGHQSGAFLGGSLGRVAIDNTDLNALRYGANGGYEMRFESMPKLRLCPVASFGYMNGPDQGTTTSSTTDYTLGAAAGTVMSASDNVAIVPSLGLGWRNVSLKVEDPTGSLDVSDDWFEARLAAGIVFNRAFTIAPVVNIPLNQDGADPRYGFAASYNFGRSSGVVQQGTKKGSRRR